MGLLTLTQTPTEPSLRGDPRERARARNRYRTYFSALAAPTALQRRQTAAAG